MEEMKSGCVEKTAVCVKESGQAGSFITAACCLPSGEIIIGTMLMELSFRADMKKIVWKKDTPASIISVGASYQLKKVFAGCGSGDLLCYDFKGKMQWHKNVQTPVSALVVSNKGILVPGASGKSSINCYGYDGELRKSFNLESDIETLSADNAGNLIAVVTTNRRLLLLDSEGEELDMGEDIECDSACISPDGLTMAVSDRNIISYYHRWKLSWSKNIKTSAGNLIISPSGRRLYASFKYSVICFDSSGNLLWVWSNPEYNKVSGAACCTNDELLVFTVSGAYFILF